jgi:intracellular septation protein A
MRDAHLVNAWLVIGGSALVGVWCLAAHRWPVVAGRPVWIGVIVVQVLVFVQAILGALLAKTEDVEIDDMHMLYGVSAIVAVGIMYSYRNSGFMKGKELVLYGLGSLFIMGLGLRNLVL